MKEELKFGIKGKLAPMYIESFEIRSRIGKVTYKIVPPPKLLRNHPIFHVSMLRKYISYSSHVLQLQVVELNEDLTDKEYLVALADRQVRQHRTKDIPMVKVLWSNGRLGQ